MLPIALLAGLAALPSPHARGTVQVPGSDRALDVEHDPAGGVWTLFGDRIEVERGDGPKVAFLEDAPGLEGLTRNEHGVFVVRGGQLLRLQDADGDGRADGSGQVILEGLGAVQRLVTSSDGWVGGTGAEDSWGWVRGWRVEAGGWRWNPRSDAFEPRAVEEPLPSAGGEDLGGWTVEALVGVLGGDRPELLGSAIEELVGRSDAPLDPAAFEGDGAFHALCVIHRRGELTTLESSAWLNHPSERARAWFAREHLAPRVEDRARTATAEDFAALTELFGDVEHADTAAVLLAALDDGLRPRREVDLGAELVAAIEATPDSPVGRPVTQVRKLRLRLRRAAPEGLVQTRGFLRYDDPVLEALRLEFLEVLRDYAEPSLLEPLIILARDSKHGVIRRAALYAIEAYDEPGVAHRLLSFHGVSPEKHAMAELLTRRRDWGLALTEALGMGALDFTSVPEELVTRLRSFDDQELTLAVNGLWGPPPDDASAARRQERLRPLATQDGDPARGVLVFRDACARCHDDAGRAAPSPSMLGDRAEDLVPALANPSAQVAARYRDVLVRTVDGRHIHGRLVRDAGDRVTVEDTLGARSTFRVEEVAGIDPVAASRMPASLTVSLGDEELRALLAWLGSR